MQNAHIGGVLVVEQDVALRDDLRELLHEAGYNSVGVSDLDFAREVLECSPFPMVVLVEHGDPRFHADALVEAAIATAERPGEARHAYVLLSTHPADAPHLRNPYTQRMVPVVELPSSLDRLTREVGDAARRLVTCSA